MAETLIDEVERLLDDERAALVSGNLPAIEEIAARKAALADRLAGARVASETLAALKRRAEENAALLDAAARGLRTATRRLSEIRSANGPLRTYGQDGAERRLGLAKGSFEKRA